MLCSIVLLAGSIILTYISPFHSSHSESYAGNLSVRDQTEGRMTCWVTIILDHARQSSNLIYFAFFSELWKWRERDVLEIFLESTNAKWTEDGNKSKSGKCFIQMWTSGVCIYFLTQKFKFASSWKCDCPTLLIFF